MKKLYRKNENERKKKKKRRKESEGAGLNEEHTNGTHKLEEAVNKMEVA